jgi:hypothetical protein
MTASRGEPGAWGTFLVTPQGSSFYTLTVSTACWWVSKLDPPYISYISAGKREYGNAPPFRLY